MSRSANILLVMIVLLPALVVGCLIAILVLVAVGRPILFTQERSGRNGRTFRIIKFRTMTDARDRHGALLPDSRRTPRLGKLLRRTRVDELPELLNILRGEMAWVGPRPLLPATVESFGDAGLRRGSVAPGLTGWAQVNGNTLLTPQEKLQLDLWYVQRRSAGLDLRILLGTLLVVLFGERRNPRSLEKAVAGHPDRRG